MKIQNKSVCKPVQSLWGQTQCNKCPSQESQNFSFRTKKCFVSKFLMHYKTQTCGVTHVLLMLVQYKIVFWSYVFKPFFICILKCHVLTCAVLALSWATTLNFAPLKNRVKNFKLKSQACQYKSLITVKIFMKFKWVYMYNIGLCIKYPIHGYMGIAF